MKATLGLLCVLTLALSTSACSDRPALNLVSRSSFLEEGGTYLLEALGWASRILVVEVGDDGWVRAVFLQPPRGSAVAQETDTAWINVNAAAFVTRLPDPLQASAPASEHRTENELAERRRFEAERVRRRVALAGEARSALTSDLKNLATTQEIYRADHGCYASELNTLEFRPSTGVEVSITESNCEG